MKPWERARLNKQTGKPWERAGGRQPQTSTMGQNIDRGAMAFGQNFANTATIGLKDHLNAAVNTAIQEGREFVAGEDKKSWRDRYSSNLKREQDFRKTLKKGSPVFSTLGEIGGYVTPGGAPSVIGRTVTKAVSKKALPNILGKAIGGAVEAGSTEGIRTGLETGDIKQAGKSAGATALIGGGIGITSRPVRKLADFGRKKAKGIGGQYINAMLRPGKAKKTRGYKVENVFKHRVDANTLEGMAKKTDAKLNDLRTRLNNLVGSKDQSVDINIKEIYDDVAKEFEGKKIKNIGKNASIKKAVDELGEEIKAVGSTDKVGVLDAIDIKRSTGKQAKFVFGEPATVSRSEVYQKFYRKLNNQLKEKLPKEYQEINKAFTELIPIETVIENRMPIAGSNYPVSPYATLSTIFGGGLGYAGGGDVESALKGAAAGASLKFLATNPRVGRSIYNTADKLRVGGVPSGLKSYGARTLSEIFN